MISSMLKGAVACVFVTGTVTLQQLYYTLRVVYRMRDFTAGVFVGMGPHFNECLDSFFTNVIEWYELHRWSAFVLAIRNQKLGIVNLDGSIIACATFSQILRNRTWSSFTERDSDVFPCKSGPHFWLQLFTRMQTWNALELCTWVFLLLPGLKNLHISRA